MIKTCVICGKTFEGSRSTAVYCSQDCRDESQRRKAAEWGRKHRKEVRAKKTVIDSNSVKCTQAVKKKCKYGLYGAREWTCCYIEKTGHMRRCPGSACTKYEADPDRHEGKLKYRKSLSIKF